MKRILRNLGFGLLAVILLVLVGFTVWAANPAAPDQTALDALSSNQLVDYQNKDGWLIFTPNDIQPTTGFIIYPGARVDYRAYAPAARDISASGFTVIVVKMPLNFAFFGINQASKVMATFPEITHWAVGGHSLGGAMAAQFTGANPEKVDGLVLWASYPAQSNDLSNTNVKVLSIFATNDGLATLSKIDASRPILPEDTIYLEIQGGNHSGFGWYGPQNGDGEAQISKSEQQVQIVDATSLFLGTLIQ